MQKLVLGRQIVRHRVVVIVAAAVMSGAAGVLGSGALENFKGGGLVDPASESALASDALAQDFGAGVPNIVLLADAGDAGEGVDGAEAKAAGLQLTSELAAEPGVSGVVSYWTSGAEGLRSTDGRTALVLAHVDGEENDALVRLEDLLATYVGQPGVLDVRASGTLEVTRQLEDRIKVDLTKAEMVAIPITMLLLTVVFGTVTAASLPLVIGGFTIVGTLAVLRTLQLFTDVSVFALNLTTALALGLGIDYSLLMVSRFREELARGLTPNEAAVECVRTAGRTILFSAATVAAALSALLVFPQFFFRSFAYAGVAVCLLAAFGAGVVLPAVLAVLGHRVERLTVRRPARRGRHAKGYFHQLAERVMRRPVLVAGSVTLVLVVLGLPFLGAQFGLPDDRVLPAGTSSREVSDEIRTEYEGRDTGAVFVVADGGAQVPEGDLTRYAAELSTMDGVSRVDAAVGTHVGGRLVSPASEASAAFEAGSDTYLVVVPTVEPLSAEGESLVAQIRGTEAPFDVAVGGQSAELVDAKASMLRHVPRALVVIGVTTFFLLFLMLGSVLLPVKALVLNLLSLTALYGAMIWVFQEGHLSDLLGFTATGTLNLAIPVLLFCIAFGLSMDYEVFLMSRIKEEHARGADNVTAVARGLQRTGGIVTAAALVMSVVFLSFATSGVSLIKLFGLGVTLAILMDAAVIRPLLVPAFMRLAGPANWWAPRPMRRFHDRFGWVEDSGPLPAGVPESVPELVPVPGPGPGPGPVHARVPAHALRPRAESA